MPRSEAKVESKYMTQLPLANHDPFGLAFLASQRDGDSGLRASMTRILQEQTLCRTVPAQCDSRCTARWHPDPARRNRARGAQRICITRPPLRAFRKRRCKTTGCRQRLVWKWWHGSTRVMKSSTRAGSQARRTGSIRMEPRTRGTTSIPGRRRHTRRIRLGFRSVVPIAQRGKPSSLWILNP